MSARRRGFEVPGDLDKAAARMGPEEATGRGQGDAMERGEGRGHK